MKKMKRNKNVCGEERLNNFYLNFVYALRVYTKYTKTNCLWIPNKCSIQS